MDLLTPRASKGGFCNKPVEIDPLSHHPVRAYVAVRSVSQVSNRLPTMVKNNGRQDFHKENHNARESRCVSTPWGASE